MKAIIQRNKRDTDDMKDKENISRILNMIYDSDNSTNMLNTLDPLLTGLLPIYKRGKSFVLNPTTDEFEEIISDINKYELWSYIPIMFGANGRGQSPESSHEINWCLEAYLKTKNNMPKNEQWKALMRIYKFNGYNFPIDVIIDAMPSRPNDYIDKIPMIYKDKENITIYRVATKNSDIKKGISWVCNPFIAKQFYNWYRTYKGEDYSDPRCYKAEINKKDIIHFFLKEGWEILQYCNVHNIEEISEKDLDIECQKFNTETTDFYIKRKIQKI